MTHFFNQKIDKECDKFQMINVRDLWILEMRTRLEPSRVAHSCFRGTQGNIMNMIRCFCALRKYMYICMYINGIDSLHMKELGLHNIFKINIV